MADKILHIDTATGALSASVLPGVGVVSETASYAGTYTAGQLVTLSAGPTATLADASTAKADAYIIDAGAGPGKVGFNGIIAGILTGATPSTEYFLGAAGDVSTTPGTIIQSVGYAVNATDLLFIPGRPPL
jgi:hypothetical protein